MFNYTKSQLEQYRQDSLKYYSQATEEDILDMFEEYMPQYLNAMQAFNKTPKAVIKNLNDESYKLLEENKAIVNKNANKMEDLYFKVAGFHNFLYKLNCNESNVDDFERQVARARFENEKRTINLEYFDEEADKRYIITENYDEVEFMQNIANNFPRRSTPKAKIEGMLESYKKQLGNLVKNYYSNKDTIKANNEKVNQIKAEMENSESKSYDQDLKIYNDFTNKDVSPMATCTFRLKQYIEKSKDSQVKKTLKKLLIRYNDERFARTRKRFNLVTINATMRVFEALNNNELNLNNLRQMNKEDNLGKGMD